MTTVRPSGTVTFLFTDIEGSTRLWEVDPASMREAVAAHEGLPASAITGHRGQVVKTMGDGVMAVFADATDAARAAFDAQLGLTKLNVFKVRMGVHTGTADERDGDYYGPTLNRAARLMGIAHGGQILLSEATAALTRGRVDLVDLGEHRLRDLNRSERVYQVTGGGLPRHFPPLRSLGSVANNLPLQLTSFVGRDDAVAAVRTLVANDRLVTLTGSAGCGKTRLAVHVAAELLDDFGDGVSFVDLAPLSDPDLVPDAIASAAGVANQSSTRTTTDTIVAHLATRRTLLLLDNCEHVLGAAAIAVQEILRGCPHVRVVATSREPWGSPVKRRGGCRRSAWRPKPNRSMPPPQCNCSPTAPGRATAGSRGTTIAAPRPPSPRSVGVSTASRWPSSWPRRGSAR